MKKTRKQPLADDDQDPELAALRSGAEEKRREAMARALGIKTHLEVSPHLPFTTPGEKDFRSVVDKPFKIAADRRREMFFNRAKQIRETTPHSFTKAAFEDGTVDLEAFNSCHELMIICLQGTGIDSEFYRAYRKYRQVARGALKRNHHMTNVQLTRQLWPAAKELLEVSKIAEGASWALNGVARLYEFALHRESPLAVDFLVTAAQLSIDHLAELAKNRISLVRSVAHSKQDWPVAATIEPGWEKRGNDVIATVQLGRKTIHSRYKSEKAYDDSFPFRKWARAIVECLEKNRVDFEVRINAMQDVHQFLDEDHTLTDIPVPQWAHDCAKLPPFKASTVKEWWTVGKTMIREQCPEFHERPEWKPYERRFEGLTRGQIQNRLFDDILSAMDTIAKSQ